MTAGPEPMITLTLEVVNIYQLYEAFTTTVNIVVAPPPRGASARRRARRERWVDAYIYPHTGSQDGVDRSQGTSWYRATVVATSRPDLIPVGAVWSFGT